MEKVKVILKWLGDSWKGIWIIAALIIGVTILFNDPQVIMGASLILAIVSFLLGTLLKDKLH